MSSPSADPSENSEAQPESVDGAVSTGEQGTASEQRVRLLARKKAMLAAWVARLNLLRNNAAYKAIERKINGMLGEVEAEEKRRAPNSKSLENQLDSWLAQNAGKVGGPEQEQDPTRPHSPGWHGEHDEPPNAQQQR
jgi:hypothetical protein